MYDSKPRPIEGEPIEEVLPAAINATATTGTTPRTTGELARRQSAGAADELRMAVMRAGSPLGQLGTLPAPLLLAGTVLLVALVVLAIVLI